MATSPIIYSGLVKWNLTFRCFHESVLICFRCFRCISYGIIILVGTNVIIANAIGRKDKKAVGQAVHTSILASLIGGLIVTLLGELFIGNFLTLLNVPDDVFPYALLYICIYLLGLPVIFLYNFEAAIFRSTGDTKVPLQALIEDAIASATAVILILGSGRFLLSLFNSDPQVIDIGYTRLVIIFSAYIFTRSHSHSL